MKSAVSQLLGEDDGAPIPLYATPAWRKDGKRARKSKRRGVVETLLGETRPTRLHELAQKIAVIPGYTRVTEWFQADGESMLLHATEGPYAGQAYEVQIRPAAYGKHPSIQAHFGTGRGTVPREFAHGAKAARDAREPAATT